jgi:hypothetical protein
MGKVHGGAMLRVGAQLLSNNTESALLLQVLVCLKGWRGNGLLIVSGAPDCQHGGIRAKEPTLQRGGPRFALQESHAVLHIMLRSPTELSS